MKLALAIVLCIGINLYAVNAIQQEKSTDMSGFQQFRVGFEGYLMYLGSEIGLKHFIEFYDRYIHFMKNVDPTFNRFDKNDKGRQEFLEKYKGKKQLLQDSETYVKFIHDVDPECQWFTKNYQGFQQFRGVEHAEYMKLVKDGNPKYKRFPKIDHAEYIKFINDDNPKYREFPKTYQGYKNCGKKERSLRRINKTYKKFLDKAFYFCSVSTRVGYTLHNKHWHNLEKADLDFKLNCIDEFDPDKTEGRAAYNILQIQIENFMEDLKNSGIDKSTAGQLNAAEDEDTFLMFFGLWFKPKCDENAFKEEIVKLQGSRNISEKAARVMVILRKYSGGRMDEKYLSEPGFWTKCVETFSTSGSK